MDRAVHLGQVFTRSDVVAKMLALRENFGRTLEPSAGDGAFARAMPGCTAIELDSTVACPGALVMDFFDWPLSEKFDSIVGNPPFVARGDILPETRAKLTSRLLDGRSNLYLHFIERAVSLLNPGGELIFITPREFTKLTAARKLNAWLATQGCFTHFEETGDSSIFGEYVPNCAIWRFEKGRTCSRLDDGRRIEVIEGQLLFLRGEYSVPMSSLFQVKVGALSAADDIFTHPEGNAEFVCSKTIDDGATRRMIFNVQHPHLEPHKERLLARGVRQFTDANWWQWGRLHHISDAPRLYVNAKTRRQRPFFTHPCRNYDGSVLALFPVRSDIDLDQAMALLNNEVDWEDLGFVCDGRFLFGQRSLQHVLLPEVFRSLL